MKHTLESLLELSKTPEGIQQIRIMVAELDGWKRENPLRDEWLRPSRSHIPQFHSSWAEFDSLPNYPEDLNAVHGAGNITHAEWEAFTTHMYSTVTGQKLDRDRINLFEACMLSNTTALQRCIALILTQQKP